jgi:hypothetical protein
MKQRLDETLSGARRPLDFVLPDAEDEKRQQAPPSKTPKLVPNPDAIDMVLSGGELLAEPRSASYQNENSKPHGANTGSFYGKNSLPSTE